MIQLTRLLALLLITFFVLSLGTGPLGWAVSPAVMTPTLTAGRLSDKLRTLRHKRQKIQAIAAQAHSALSNPKTSQPSFKRWRDVVVRAQALIKKLDVHIAVAETRLARLPPSISASTHTVALTRLDGKREFLTTHRGTVILLHFWATWCRPCVKEMPQLQFMRRRFQGQNFIVLAVSLDARGKDVRRFLQRKGMQIPVYLDPGRTIYQQLIGSPVVLPRSVLIDQNGRMVRSYAGEHHLSSPSTYADIRQLLSH